MKNIIKPIKITGFILITSVMLIACSDAKTDSQSNDIAINVKVSTPALPQGKGFFSASGQIEASQFANISTRHMGYISQIFVKVGDKVKKGQPLIHVNNTDMEARRAQAKAGLNQAQARFDIAEKDYNRFTTLFEQNSASQKELDDMKTQYDVAAAQVESAKQMLNEVEAMLSYSNIKAPFSGVVTSKSVNMGDMANPGQLLLSLETPGSFVANVMVPETEISNVQTNDTVKVYLKSSGGSITGTVSEVSTSSQHTGGQYLVKIQLSETSGISLYSGMFVSTLFSTNSGSANNQILIPKSALIKKGELQGVYTVSSSGTAILRWLKLGRSIGDQIEVLSGISEGEQYIVSAEGKLYNGVKININ
jgi:RND family efflux transporter MFP subunit